MAKGFVFVALGCGRIPGLLEFAGRRPFIVLATMDGNALTELAVRPPDGFTDVEVYFYESG